MPSEDFLYQLTVNERSEFKLDEKEIADLDFVKTASNSYHLIYNDNTYRVEVDKVQLGKGLITINVNGNTHKVKIETPLKRKIRALGINELNAGDGEVIKAPMPGKVLSILVKEGDPVESGQDLLILEAMKMENVIKCSQDGVVDEIHIDEADTVDKNQTLLETKSGENDE